MHTADCGSHTEISKTNIASIKMLVRQLLVCYNGKMSHLRRTKIQMSSACMSLLLLPPLFITVNKVSLTEDVEMLRAAAK